MNQNVENLYKIAQKQERLIIGLMSGTSLDGLDIALCKVKGSGMATQIPYILKNWKSSMVGVLYPIV